MVFNRKSSCLTLSFPPHLSLTPGTWSLLISLVSASPALGLQVQAFMWVPGVRLRYSCLWGQHFLDWPILPVLLWLFRVEMKRIDRCVCCSLHLMSLHHPDMCLVRTSFERFFENAVILRGLQQASLCQSAHVWLSLIWPPDWHAYRVILRQIISSTEEESN